MDKDNLYDDVGILRIGDMVTIPCVPMRGAFIYPNMTKVFDIGRRKSIFAAKKALSANSFVFLTAQRDETQDRPSQKDLYEIGTIAIVNQIVNQNDGIYRCIAEGLTRGKLISFSGTGNGYEATVEVLDNYGEEIFSDEHIKATERLIKSCMAEIHDRIDFFDDEVMEKIRLADKQELFELIAFRMSMETSEHQKLLELDSLGEKLLHLFAFLDKESEIIQMEDEVHQKVQDAINENQREFYIREQIHALQEELGESADAQGDFYEIEEYKTRLMNIKNMNDTAREKLLDEIERMSKLPTYSQEASLIRTYLDICLALPWDIKTVDTTDVEQASKILEEDHYGIHKVKERILETIAVRKIVPEIRGQILCLYGPPGTGKTSVAKSVARALNRTFVRVSLGGIRDESDIRGHRKTYLGSMPGRIISGINQAGTSNPVMLLDEIDKMANDYRGDPASALLEVLDPEQNSQFRDHYTEIPFDLSDVLFITTANTTNTISPPLLDRMELIELNSYTREEKFNIAKKHLIPKQMKKHGLKTAQMRILDSAVYALIDSYTREAGVRKLEQQIASLCRKAAKEYLSTGAKVSFKASNLEKYLGAKKYLDEYFLTKPSVGCVNGLAWTSVGGVIMPLETLVLDGKGRIEFTGSLGDVMKESAKLAVSNARRLAKKYGISSDFYEKKDIHIHAPEGAVPKDGPSAGVTMTTALISALSGISVRSDITMTGEITLTGKVLAIGGLKEKTMAAYKSKIKTVIIPEANSGDLDELDEKVREAIEFVAVKTIEDVLDTALVAGAKPARKAPQASSKGTKHTTEVI
ncbi:MAG: endopeptidase La [Ruminococcus sp.]|nr:endopeptidase La [Ruminococcus sp.]